MTLIAAQIDSIWGDQPLTIVLTVSGVLYDSAVMSVAEVAGVSVASATIDTSDYDAVLVDATIRTDVGAIVWVGQFQLDADGELIVGGNAAIAATQATTAATEIGKVHRSATAVAAGASMRRTKAAATSTTLDETLGATP